MKKKLISQNSLKFNFFCPIKDNNKIIGKQNTDWKKIFAKDTSDKGSLFKIYKKNLNSTISKNPSERWAKAFNKILRQRYDKQMENKHMKRCSTSYVMRAMQHKTM